MDRKGFTLVSLLMVLLVFSIMAAIAVPSMVLGYKLAIQDTMRADAVRVYQWARFQPMPYAMTYPRAMSAGNRAVIAAFATDDVTVTVTNNQHTGAVCTLRRVAAPASIRCPYF